MESSGHTRVYGWLVCCCCVCFLFIYLFYYYFFFLVVSICKYCDNMIMCEWDVVVFVFFVALCSCGVCLAVWFFFFFFSIFFFNKRNVHVWPELSVHKSV